MTPVRANAPERTAATSPSMPTRWSSALERLEERMLCAADFDVALIDRTLPDHALLVRALQPGGKVFLYDGQNDSAEQILSRVTRWAEQTGSRLRSLSLMSHGAAGRFALGSDWITNSSLDDLEDHWQGLAKVLADGASINLFGCNLVDRLGDGKILIKRLSRLTGATVFASTDLTGRGGDWTLEAASDGILRGRIGIAASPFSTKRLSRWGGTLASPLGGETLINGTTTGTQQTQPGSQSVATDAAGNFVVVWSGEGPGDTTGIFAQRYSALGAPLGSEGSEFRVNTTTAGTQTAPSIAMNAAGEFIITWSGQGSGDVDGIFAQRYTASGTPAGAEFRVNTTTADLQQHASVAISDAGSFVITWTSANQDGEDGGIYAQRYDAAGTALAGEFLVNFVTTNNDQDFSRIAMDAGGNFVITWASVISTSFGWGIAAQRFAADGTALGTEVIVNTTIANNQQHPSIAMSLVGSFVITWQSAGQDGSGIGIYAQRFDAAGARQGGEFRVNTTTANDQQYPSAAMDDAGNFTIAWQSADGAGWGVYAQDYDAAGSALGGEYLVNTTTTGQQQFASTAMDANGDFVVAWSGAAAGDSAGIFARRYRSVSAGITVTQAPDLVTSEAGGTASFTIVLDHQPTADVVLTFTSSDTAEGTVTSSLTFTPANWNVAQTVTITGVDDFIDDGDVEYEIAVVATSADAAYDGFAVEDVEVENSDDDAAGIIISAAANLTTTEGGGTAAFTVVLASQPTANVTINLSSSDLAEGTLSVSSLTFTAANWDQPQIVTVTGVDDLVDEPDDTHDYSIITAPATSSDAQYNGRNAEDVPVTNLDNDVAGFTIEWITPPFTTESGGTAQFTIVLNTMPASAVVVSIDSSDVTEGSATPNNYPLNTSNWNVPQPITVTGIDDALLDGDILYRLTISAASSDGQYDGLEQDLDVTNLDDDTPGITVTPTSLTVSESGTTGTFGVVLDKAPTQDVLIDLLSSDESEGTLSGVTSLLFTPANWNIQQFVTVTGVDDFIDDGDVSFGIILLPARSADASYDGLDPADVSVTSSDDDTAGITLSRTSGLVTTEAGGTDSYMVVLDSQPLDDVIISIFSNDSSEGQATVTLIFTPANWNIPQVVVITGVDDSLDDGDVAFIVVNQPAQSNDPNYDGRNPANVNVTNLDNDPTPTGPTITTGGAALDYPENDGPRAIDALLVVADADGFLSSATIRIVTGYVRGEDRLVFAGTSGISATWNSSGGTLTLTGSASVAAYEAALRGVTFENTSDNPTGTSRTIRFIVSDGTASDSAEKSIMITPVNDAPVALEEQYTVSESSGLMVGAPAGVLSNDFDAEDDALSAVLMSAPSMGELTLNSDGSFSYIPDAGAAGIDSFVYRASDGQESGEAVTVTLTVDIAEPPEDDPVDPPLPPEQPPVDPPVEPETPPIDNPEPPMRPEEPEDPPGSPREPSPRPRSNPGPLIRPTPTVDREPLRVQSPDLSRFEKAEALALRYTRIEPPAVDARVDDPQPDNAEAAPAETASLVKWEITETLSQSLDQLADQITAETQTANAAAAVVGSAALVWVGYVVYSLRGGALLLTFLTSMPLWRTLDPLPVLEASEARAAARKKRKKRRNEPDDPDERKLRSVLG